MATFLLAACGLSMGQSALRIEPIGDQNAGEPFDVTITVVNVLGVPTPPAAQTEVEISLAGGSGVSSGTLTGAGTAFISPGDPVNPDNVTVTLWFTPEANNIRLRADVVSGPPLTSAFSNLFDVGPFLTPPPEALQIAPIADQQVGVPFDVKVSVVDGSGAVTPLLQPRQIRLSPGELAPQTVTLGVGDTVASFTVSYTQTEIGRTVSVEDLSGLPLDPDTSNAFDVGPGKPAQLSLDYAPSAPYTSVVQNLPFTATVELQDAFGNLAEAPINLGVQLQMVGGTGTLTGGSGTIPLGDSSVTFDPLVYDVVEAGVQLRASVVGGFGPIPAVLTAPFDVELVDIRPDSALTLDTSVPGQTIANVDYVVESPDDLDGFSIQLRVQYADGTPDAVVSTFALAGPVSPGGYTLSEPIRSDLDGLAKKLSDGDQLVALFDSNFEHLESDETNNEVISDPVTVDLAVALSDALTIDVDTDNDLTSLTLAYEVISPAQVEDYSIRFGVRYLDGTPDVLLPTVYSGATAPGEHTLVTENVRSDLNGLAKRLGHGDQLFAVLDTENTVDAEADDTNNEAVVDVEVNLVQRSLEVSLSPDMAATYGALTYEVVSPANVDPFAVRFGLRRDDDPGNPVWFTDPPLIFAGDVRPGVHTLRDVGDVLPDLRPNLDVLANLGAPITCDDQIIAEIDFPVPGAVVESDETDNESLSPSLDVDLAGESISVELLDDTVTVYFTYLVEAPANVADDVGRYDIELRVEGEASPLVTLDGNVSPGTHTLTQSVTSELVADLVRDGAQLTAEVNTDGVVAECDDTNNTLTSNPLTVNLRADNLALETTATETRAVFSWEVDGYADVPAYDVQLIARYADGSGDVLLGTYSGEVSPGTYTITPDIRPALDGLVVKLSDGDQIVAVLDPITDPVGFPDGFVLEENEGDNETDTTVVVDLVADSVTLDVTPSESRVSVAYAVSSPADIAAYEIRLGVRYADGVTPDEWLPTTYTGEVTPGTHTLVTGNIRNELNGLATSISVNDRIIAEVDPVIPGVNEPFGDVVESDEANNLALSTGVTVDLVIDSVTLDVTPSESRVSVAYAVNSPADIAAYEIRLGVRYADGVTPDEWLPTTYAGEIVPGTHTLVTGDIRNELSALGVLLSADDQIIAEVDPVISGVNEPFGDVVESDEANNLALSTGVTVDLVIDSVTLDVTPSESRVSVAYAVNSPADIAAYEIRLGVRYADGVTPDEWLPTTYAGEMVPGTHTLVTPDVRGELSALGVLLSADDQIIAEVDPVISGVNEPFGDVVESDEANNLALSTGVTVDLVIDSVTLDVTPSESRVSVAYAVNSPADIAAYEIRLGVRYADGVTPDEWLPTTYAGEIVPGTHTLVTPDVRGELSALVKLLSDGDEIIAELDPVISGVNEPLGDVVESDEANNLELSTGVTVDLVVDSVALEEAVVVVTYSIHAPADVADFRVHVGLDQLDHAGGAPANGMIDPAELLGDFGAGPYPVSPGTHVIVADVRAGLDALGIDNGEVILAEIDPTDAVVEMVEGDLTASEPLAVDIRAVRLSLDAILQATLTYSVSGQANVSPYTINFYRDGDGDGVLTPAADILLGSYAGDVTPGTHTIMQPYRVDPPAMGDAIFAEVDTADVIAESLENNTPLSNNVAQSARGQDTDLVAGDVDLIFNEEGGQRTIRGLVTYTIHSALTDVPAFSVRVGVSRDGDNIIDADSVLTVELINDIALRSVGTHTVQLGDLVPALEALATPIRDGDLIVATLDLVPVTGADEAAVDEADEVNNNVVVKAARVNLEVNEVTLIQDIDTAEIAYAVDYTIDGLTRLGGAFALRLQWDVGDDGTIDGQTDIQVGGASDPLSAPGTHRFVAQFPDGLASLIGADSRPVGGQAVAVTATIDPADAIGELSDGDNAATVTEPYRVDLEIISVFYEGIAPDTPFDATIEYRVNWNTVLQPFSIGLFAVDDLTQQTPADSARVVNGSLTVDVPPFAAVGEVLSVTVENLRVSNQQFAALSQQDPGLVIKVWLDDEESVVESIDTFVDANGDEVGGNNIATFPNRFANDPDNDGDGLTRSQERDGFFDLVTGQAGRLKIDPNGNSVVIDAAGDLPTPVIQGGRRLNDPTVSNDDLIDSDGDGLPDDVEEAFGTFPGNTDTDMDGLSDSEELDKLATGLDPEEVVTLATLLAALDDNNDGRIQFNEMSDMVFSTDPRRWDTDGDGLSDSEELNGFRVTEYPVGITSGRFNEAYTSDPIPTDPNERDTDGDGISDWNEVNTYARAAEADGSVPSIGLGPIAKRANRVILKPVPGVRTNPRSADTDEDTVEDRADAAPQINPVRFGYDRDGDGAFTQEDVDVIIAEILADAEFGATFDASAYATPWRFQVQLLNFDQDGDGFLEAPDANADGFPDFTRFSEATLERAFGIDFSNNGSLDDGFDVGGLNQGERHDPSQEANEVFRNRPPRFGSYRVMRDPETRVLGNGILDLGDDSIEDPVTNPENTQDTSTLIPTDNCPNTANPSQEDFDGDGLGSACDADRDNDRVGNELDDDLGIVQEPFSNVPPICGFGITPALALTLAGLFGLRGAGIRRRRL